MDTSLSTDKLYNKSSDDSFLDTAEMATPDMSPASDATVNDVDPEELARQKEEWQLELQKTEEEINTLRQVLSAKVKHSSELKQKLGITPLNTIKTDLAHVTSSIKSSDAYNRASEQWRIANEKVTQSTAYQKTNAALKTAGEKSSQAIGSMSSTVSKKLGDVRNSNTFKSFEEKVGSAYTSVKTKVVGSKSEDNFESALSSEQNNTNGVSQPLPEEKVPL